MSLLDKVIAKVTPEPSDNDIAAARAQLSGQPATEAPSAPVQTQGEQTGTVTPQQ